MPYKSPTLNEVYIELFLEKNSLLSEKVIKVSEELKTIGLPKITFGAVMNPSDLSRRISIRCGDSEGKRLVQIAEDFFIVNQTSGYLGWQEVKKLFSNSLNVLLKAIKKDQIKAISYNAMDQFSLVDKEFSIEKYFNCDGIIISKWFQKTKTSVDINYGKGLLFEDGYNQQINISAKKVGETINTAFSTILQNVIDEKEDVLSVLDRIEKQADELFEKMITDKYRNEIMGGKI